MNSEIKVLPNCVNVLSNKVCRKYLSPIGLLFDFGFFPFVPPQFVMLPSVTEHVPLHAKSLCKNIARASGGANNMHPLSWGGGGGHKRKRSSIFVLVLFVWSYYLLTAFLVFQVIFLA